MATAVWIDRLRREIDRSQVADALFVLQHILKKLDELECRGVVAMPLTATRVTSGVAERQPATCVIYCAGPSHAERLMI